MSALALTVEQAVAEAATSGRAVAVRVTAEGIDVVPAAPEHFQPWHIPCLDGGDRHSWRSDGLDLRIVGGREQTRRIHTCEWCGTERTKPL